MKSDGAKKCFPQVQARAVRLGYAADSCAHILDGEQPGPYQDDMLLPEIIAAIVNEYGYTEALAEKLHRDLTYYSYGLALLANSGHLNLTDAELLASFRREFTALAGYDGVSPVPLKLRRQEEQ